MYCLQETILLTIFQMLRHEIRRVFDLVIDNFAVLHNWNNLRIDETTVRLQAQGVVTFLDFPVDLRIDSDVKTALVFCYRRSMSSLTFLSAEAFMLAEKSFSICSSFLSMR